MIDFTIKKRKSLGRGKGFLPMEDELQKTEKILFRLSKNEKNFIDKYCENKKIKRSDLLRNLLSERMTKEMYNTLYD